MFSGAFLSAAGAILKIFYNLAKDDTDGLIGKRFDKFVNKIIDKKIQM
ncbi:MAG: hypothetical protein L6V95_11585 [Candidatus Melainabacteria bacterium]|nr:MAG: hypothetical protein L6V95_11585 [Candidatus Melainabacteria bacterium]